MSKSKNFVLGFVLGSAAAIATTYLLTPQTTTELKRKLREGKDQISDRAADYFEYAKDATGDLRNSAEEFVTGLKTKIEKPEPLDLDDYDAATAEVRAAVTDDDDDEEDETSMTSWLMARVLLPRLRKLVKLQQKMLKPQRKTKRRQKKPQTQSQQHLLPNQKQLKNNQHYRGRMQIRPLFLSRQLRGHFGPPDWHYRAVSGIMGCELTRRRILYA